MTTNAEVTADTVDALEVHPRTRGVNGQISRALGVARSWASSIALHRSNLIRSFTIGAMEAGATSPQR